MTLVRCIDIESTGLDPAVDRIVEIATVDVIVHGGISESMDLDRGKDATPKIERGAMWSSLVNPERPIPPEASAVHDITDEMVASAPKITDIGMHLIGMDPPNYYCAHNSRFDSKFFMPKDAVWLDTYRIALWLWPGAPEHKLATLRYWLKLKLAGTGYDDRHRSWRSHTAMWDAYVCAAVLRRAFAAGATIEQMVEVSSQPALLPRFTFGQYAMWPIEEIPSSYFDWILSPKGIEDNEDVRHTAFAELQRRRNLARLET